MSRDVDADAQDAIEAVNTWIEGVMLDLGESPEAMRGAASMCNALVFLCDTIRDKPDVRPEIKVSTQLIGVIAVIAGVMDRIQAVAR